MPAPAYIVNTGIITAIGSDTDACLRSLLSGRSGIGRAEILQTAWADEIPAGEVRMSNQTLAAITDTPETWPRTALLSAVAVQEVWAPFDTKNAPFPLCFFSANTVGGMDRTEAFYPKYLHDKSAGEPADFINHECGTVTQLVARHFGFKGFTTTISTACSSSANSIMMAAQMIRAGMLDVAVAGGADALCRFTLNGFNTLGILDRRPCQPFDAQRRGLNLGEGAGYVVLMSERALMEYGAEPLCTVSGWGNANDAYHQTASSPDGIGNTLAMEGALRIAGLSPADMSYINLHGTGTANNDSAEGIAIEKIFGQHVPPASSTKAFTGHTLGAAGAVEAVFSTLAICERLIFPNLRWTTQMEDVSFAPVASLRQGQDVRHVLSNSFGFGGACSSLIFSPMLKPELYIHGAGLIVPEVAPNEPVVRLSALEPDYAGLIPPMQLRRMSKAVRMGIGAAKACLDGAGMQTPDAIAVGTAMGCLQDTEVFLSKLVTQEERMLTPTSFIQSTHNTVAGQIALVTGCHGCNTTISQHGHSFEGAVMSAALYLAEHPGHSVLCGGVDELTDTSFALMQRAGVYTSEPYAPGDLLQEGKGAIAGEGAGFLLLNKNAKGAKAQIAGLHIFSEKEMTVALKEIQGCMSPEPSRDALWLGVSGDARQHELYQRLLVEWSGEVLLFKQYTGEWGTVIAAALSRAAFSWPQHTDRIWVVNHHGRDWSVWLLERV